LGYARLCSTVTKFVSLEPEKEMLMKQVTGFVLALFTAASASAFAQAEAAGTNAQATAEIMDTEGKVVGNAALTTTDKGVEVQVNLRNFQSAADSEHGLHIHQMGKCKPTFDAAGDHFNPLDHHHGYLRLDGPHAGDLPNIWVEANGSARYSYTTNLIALKEGKRAILDADGSALIIHAKPDDYLTGSSGATGDPIACGVITSAAG
jgi:Cu-Zn family superoxide dismutase